MKERPILFSAPMVRALLDGRKTQTRRLVKPQPVDGEIIQRGAFGRSFFVGRLRDSENAWLECRCPYGAPGDRLWVRETFCEAHPLAFHEGRIGKRLLYAGIPGPPPVDYLVGYRADGELLPVWSNTGGYPWRTATPPTDKDEREFFREDIRWTPSIHMPRRASRITLEITDVRVERLHEISEADAIAEGLTAITKDGGRTVKYGITDRDGAPGTDDTGWPWRDWNQSPVQSYRHLWESINGANSWAANPWVWVVSFERVARAAKVAA